MAEMLAVTEEASVTVIEKQDVSRPVLEDDGVTPVLNDDGTQKMKTVKEDVRIPIALHAGDVYDAGHEYVKKWPHLFGNVPVKA